MGFICDEVLKIPCSITTTSFDEDSFMMEALAGADIKIINAIII